MYSVTRELTFAFLAKKAARDRIREVVEFRVPRGTQESDIQDIVQEANLRAMTTTASSVPGFSSRCGAYGGTKM